MFNPRHLQPVTDRNNKQHLRSYREDTRLHRTDSRETTGLVQRTLTGQIASSICKCGKVWKNARGLKIHQSKCGKHLQHEQHKGSHLSETQKDSSQDYYPSAEVIQALDEGADSQDPNLSDLLDGNTSYTDSNTQPRDEPRQRQQPTTVRKPRVKWPTQWDKKSWQLFNGDLDTILSVAL
jgi:hypothetical protein